MFLKQSTTTTVSLGPFVCATDGKTPVTDLYTGGANAMTVYLSKNGGTAAARNSATSITHDRDGYYRVELNTTDTATAGLLELFANATGALPVWRHLVILTANNYDALIAGNDALQVHANEITANLITAAALAADAGTEIATAVWANATRTLSASGDPTAAQIADAVWDEARADHTAAGTFGQGAASVQGNITGSVGSVTNPVTAGTVSDKTGYALSAAGVSAVQAGLSTLTAAQVNAEADAALSGVGLTTTVTGRIDAAISTRLPTASYTAPANADVAAIKAQTDKLAFTGTGPYDVKATLDGETVTAAAVSDKAGYSLSAAGVTSVQSGLSTLTTAQVNAEVDTALSDAGVSTTVMGRLDAAVSTRLATAGYTAPANADVAAIKAQTDKLAFAGAGPYDVKATLDGETVTAATVSDKTGYTLSAAGVSAVQSGLSTLTAAQVNAEADQALADVGLTTAVTARIDQAISSRLATTAYTAPANADIAAIKSRTDNLPDSPAAVGSEMALGGASTAAVAAAVWAATDRALSIDPPTVAQIADAVWDENGSDHISPDTTGNKLNSASAAGDPWTASLSGYGAGSAGKLVYDNLNAPVSSRSSHDAPAVAAAVWSSPTRTLANDPALAAIKTQTDKIVAGGATVAHLQPAAEAAILANLGNITADILNGNLASVAAPGNLAGTLIDAAADPWAQAELGGYAAGSAGRLLADNLNAPVGSRASHTPADAADAVWSAADRTLAGDANLAAIKAQTDKIVTGGAAVADLLPAATAAIQNARLHQLVAAPFAAPAAGSLLAGLVEAHAAAWRFTAAALGATPVIPPVIDTAAIASAVWSAAASGWAPDTMGQRLTADMPDAALIAATVWSASLAGYNAPNTAGALLKNTTSFPTPAQIAAQLWETSTAGYANLTGTMGHRLHTATPAGIAAAVWNATKTAYTTAGTFGALLDAPVSGRLPHVAGSGPVAFTYSLTSQSDNSAIEGVEVVVTDDITGYHVVAEAVTAGNGSCVFNLSPGTYYFWRHKPGWSFVDPDTQTVNA